MKKPLIIAAVTFIAGCAIAYNRPEMLFPGGLCILFATFCLFWSPDESPNN